MFKKWLSILTFPFIFISCEVSGQVESKAYDKLLGTLLSHSTPEVSVAQVSETSDSVVFLDAREQREYEVSHIQNAKLVGYDHFDISNVKDIPKDAKIVVYCSVGYRSEKIAEKLMSDGFTDVSNLYGGIFEWKNQENPVYSGQSETEEVHAFNKTWGRWLNKGKKVYK